MARVTLAKRVRDMVGDALGASIVELSLEKAIQEARENANAPKATFYDPLELFMGREWVQRSNQTLDPATLRQMAKNPIIGSIVSTRINQMAAFCSIQQKEYDLGFKIVSSDPTIELEPGLTQAAQEWIYTCGMPGYGEDLLETLVRKTMRDSLILDQCCAEIVNRRNGVPAYLVAVDGGSIKKMRAALNYATPPGKAEVHYVQVLDDQIAAKYSSNEMIFGIRNPQTDLSYNGYGMPELEILVRTVTAILNTEKYNSGMLSAGGMQKGVLVVAGDVDNTQFDTFKRDFREATRNAASYWRPPVIRISKDGKVEWKQLDQANRDMEYAALFDFLVKEACGVYQIDPSEINWQIGASGASTTFEGRSDTKASESKKRGLKPLLTFFANQLNVNVIGRVDPQLKLEFVGLDQDRETEAKVLKEETATIRTVNEARKDKGWKPIPGGDIILSEVYFNFMHPPVPKEGPESEEKVDVLEASLNDRLTSPAKALTIEDLRRGHV